MYFHLSMNSFIHSCSVTALSWSSHGGARVWDHWARGENKPWVEVIYTSCYWEQFHLQDIFNDSCRRWQSHNITANREVLLMFTEYRLGHPKQSVAKTLDVAFGRYLLSGFWQDSYSNSKISNRRKHVLVNFVNFMFHQRMKQMPLSEMHFRFRIHCSDGRHWDQISAWLCLPHSFVCWMLST